MAGAHRKAGAVSEVKALLWKVAIKVTWATAAAGGLLAAYGESMPRFY